MVYFKKPAPDYQSGDRPYFVTFMVGIVEVNNVKIMNLTGYYLTIDTHSGCVKISSPFISRKNSISIITILTCSHDVTVALVLNYYEYDLLPP